MTRNDGVHYQYFWLKIMTREEVQRSRKEALESNGTRPDGSYQIMRPGIVPKKSLTGAQGIEVSVGVFPPPAAVGDKNLVVDAREFEPAYTKEEVAAWIDTEPGRKWRGDSFAVMCSVAIRLPGTTQGASSPAG